MTLEPTRYHLIGADGQEYGPATNAEVHEWIAEGRANGKTLIRAEKETAWHPLTELPEFSDALLAAKRPKTLSAPNAPEIPDPPKFQATPAIIGLGLGIASLLCCCIVPLPLGGMAVSGYALWRIKNGKDNPEEKGLAIIGLILSAIGLLASILLLFYIRSDLSSAAP